jgi:hypothetical protein
METVKNEIIRFVDSKKKVQIGTLSNHLINKQVRMNEKSIEEVDARSPQVLWRFEAIYRGKQNLFIEKRQP